jgi:hypothetical protein
MNAIIIIKAFSIKVASVIGSFRVVPRHAQLIDFLFKSVCVTPTDVMPRTIIVNIKAILTSILVKNIIPNNISIKGYIIPYNGTFFASGSYILNEIENPLISRILKKLKII